MAYKLDGAKFETLEDLVDALYPIYSSEMSLEEFKKYCEEKAEKSWDHISLPDGLSVFFRQNDFSAFQIKPFFIRFSH